MARKTSIPATPAAATPEMYSFLESLRQNIQRIDDVNRAAAADIATAMRYTETQVNDIGRISVTGTVVVPNPSRGAFQRLQNAAAHVLNPPSQNCQIVLNYANVTGAGAITIAGFSKVTGTAPPPTNSVVVGEEFMARVTVINSFSLLEWLPLQ